MEIIETLDGIRIFGTENELELARTDTIAFLEKIFGPLEDWQKEIVREEIHRAAMSMCGFSIRGTQSADDPENIIIDSVQIVRKHDAIRAGRQTGKIASIMRALGTLVPPREVIEPEEWAYAAPVPEERGRQAFKHVANKSSWSRHDGRKKHR